MSQLPLSKAQLEFEYLKKRHSVREIAKLNECSQGRVNYWLGKYSIPKRSISDAVYARCNPNGDPFVHQELAQAKSAFLAGLGLGLYWGEGNKKNQNTVRMGNTDPHLVRAFLSFLRVNYKINESKLRFGIQIFSDMDVEREEKFWRAFLDMSPAQFYRTTVTRARGAGTYREKTEHGVLTVYFGNKRLRDLLVGEIDKLRKIY